MPRRASRPGDRTGSPFVPGYIEYFIPQTVEPTVRPGCYLAALTLIVAPLTSHAQEVDRFHDYLHDEFSPFAMLSVTVGAGISTLQRSPHWWDKDEGFGYRPGTNFASHTVDVSVRDGLAAVMHQDTRYM